MKVEGVLKQNVSIDVSNEELFRSLCSELGFYTVFYHPYELRYILEDNKLVEQEDISHHGSPLWNNTGKVINDIDTYRALCHIKSKLLKGRG